MIPSGQSSLTLPVDKIIMPSFIGLPEAVHSLMLRKDHAFWATVNNRVGIHQVIENTVSRKVFTCLIILMNMLCNILCAIFSN